jgi:hypothetical protein
MLYVTDDNGWPLRKLHGFGVGVPGLISLQILFRRLFILAADGSVCELLHLWLQVVAFSARSSKRLKFGQHLDTNPAADREAIRAYLERERPAYVQRSDTKGTRIFFAGNTGTVQAERRLIERGARRRLLSFAIVGHNFEKAYLPVYRDAMTM